jgi:hypothetical protein
VKRPGTSSEVHADVSFFQHNTSFFSKFDTSGTRRLLSAEPCASSSSSSSSQSLDDMGCALCSKPTSPSSCMQPLSAASSSQVPNTVSRFLTCNICKCRCHVACIQAAEAGDATGGVSKMMNALVSKQNPTPSWHCKQCASQPIKMYTCWSPLVSFLKVK